MKQLVEWLRQTREELDKLGGGGVIRSTARLAGSDHQDFDQAVADALERLARKGTSV